MNTRPWLRLASLFVVCLMVGVAVPFSLAYIIHQSNTIVNAFGAEYTEPAPASVTLRLKKTMRDLGTVKTSPQGFRFTLQTQDGETVETLTTDAAGFAEYSLTYTAHDLQTEHIYRLKEVNDRQTGITYDETVYTLTVRLKVNDDNRIVAETFVNGRPAPLDVTFENISRIEPVIPMTGDDTNLLLYALLLVLSGIGLACLMYRRHDRLTR